MDSEQLIGLISFMVILGGVVVFVMAAYQRGKLRELAHRERLAMIERGLAPAPEVDPARFERAMGQADWDDEVLARSGRFRRAGVLIMGLGLGLWFMITFAGGEPSNGFGVGGAIFVLGAALYLNSQLELKEPRPGRKRAARVASPQEPREPHEP